MKRLRFHSLLVVTAAGVACAAPPSEESLGSAQEAIVVRGSEIIRAPEYGSTPVTLGAHGQGTASDLDTSVGVAHNLTFTSGNDDAYLPAPYAPGSETNFVALAAGGANSQFESTPAFNGYLTTAINTNVALLNSTDPDHSARPVLDTVKSALAPFASGEIHVTGPTTNFQGYTPVQARWAHSKYTQAGQSNGVYKQYKYPDPTVAGEIRERGARLYCAARQAVKQQSLRPDARFLGEQVALPINILGLKIDIGVVQATLTLDGPERYTGGAYDDGGQAFHVPMLAGAKMIPIRGLPLVPDLIPELRNPIVLTTGDSEILAATTKTAIPTSYSKLCLPTCIPFYGTTNDSMQVDKTVTHADAIGSSYSHLDWSSTFPIFTMGAFTATMTLGTKVEVGQPQPIDNGRLLTGISSYPAGRSEGPSPLNAAQYYEDSPLQIVGGIYNRVDSAVTAATTTKSYPIAAFDPMLMRWEHDDDHHISTRSRLELDAGVTGELGFSYGSLQLNFKATGEIKGGFNLDTHVRDEATILQGVASGTLPPPKNYLTNVTVTPATSTDLSFQLGLNMHVFLPTPVGDINTDIAIFNPDPISKTFGGDPWKEQHRLRLGTGSNQGTNVTNQPYSVSHLPSNQDDGSIPTFDAFSSQSVDACLADTTPNPPLPPRCPHTTQTGTTPHIHVCAVGHEAVGGVGFGNASQWAGACSSSTATDAAALAMAGGSASSPYYACYKGLLSYLCSATSKGLTSPLGVSHIIDTSTSVSSDTRLADALKSCAVASAGTPPDRMLTSTLEFKVCDDTARPLTPEEILSLNSTYGSTTPEPVGTVKACK